MLYIVDVRLEDAGNGDIIKHRILLIGCEQADIERKLRWIFQGSYKTISVSGIQKVREKVHYLNTYVTRKQDLVNPVIKRNEGSMVAPQGKLETQETEQASKLYAIGVSTTMFADTDQQAIRKLGHALINKSVGGSHSGAALSQDATLTIEEIPKPSRFAAPRDTSNEANRACIVRG